MSSKAIFLLRSARRQGIHISVNKGELQLKLSGGNTIDPLLLQQIKDNKEGIIDFLNNTKEKSTKLYEPETALKRYDTNTIKQVPLSYGQERLRFIDALEGTVQYHVPAVLRLRGRLSGAGLGYAFRQVLVRHESLRSVIYEQGGEYYQRVLEAEGWELSVVEGGRYKNDKALLDGYVKELVEAPFDLSGDYMLRATLISVDEAEHVLVVTMHHIASDGWSVPVIVGEVAELYGSYVEGRRAELAPVVLQYADYALWQRERLVGALLEEKTGYWKEQLLGVPLLQLPTDYSRPVVQSTRGSVCLFNIEEELTEGVQRLGHAHGATLFMTLLAAFKVLLYRYSGQEDICVGTPIAGRGREELEGMIGFFVNTLALRTRVEGEGSFLALLGRVKETTISAYEHQEVPFEKVVEVVVKERDLGRSPLFQVMFVLQNTPGIPELGWPGVSVSVEPRANTTSRFDLTFFLRQTEKGLEGSVEYCSNLYREQTIGAMIGHYTTLLEAIMKAPGEKTGLLPMLSQKEVHQLLVGFNDTSVVYPEHKSIAGLFEEQVMSTPDRVAVVFEGKELTYQELNERSNQLAHYLTGRGVGRNTLVPVCVERSFPMVIAVLGILKAGAAYVPVDPDYPPDRVLYMMEDLQAGLIVTTRRGRSLLPVSDKGTVIEIDGSEQAAIGQCATGDPVTGYEPGQLAYLLYTSGSTGRPKGVKMSSGGLVNLLSWQEKQFVNKRRRVLQFASLNFDVSFQELFSTLCFGGTLYLIDAVRRKDVEALLEAVTRHGITHLFIPYIVLKNIADHLVLVPDASLRIEEVVVAGEQLKLTAAIRSLLRHQVGSLINQYGPTEAHVVSSYRIGGGQQAEEEKVATLPPIGKPVDNTQVYILDKGNRLVPAGVFGELHIGGVQVARGYLHQPAQTAEKFISDFFSKTAGARLYKTGDLARWLPDGNLEYGGRIDDQVKIRGFRIEPGEIESVLEQCDLVEEGVVLSREDKEGGRQLVGYVVPRGGFDREGIMRYLESKLPAYMVPLLWVEMDRLPVTANGKVNRQLLLQREVNEVREDTYVAPGSETERVVARIWQELLGIERIGIYDNFFELGGHSLLSMRVLSAIRRELQVEVGVREFFVHPTIAGLSSVVGLQVRGRVSTPVVAVVPRPERIPLSFSQERLWFIDRLEGSIQYHLPSVLRLRGEVDKGVLEQALQYIVNRHEVLRSVILEEEGRSYQRVKEWDGWRLGSGQGGDDKNYQEDKEGLQQYIHELVMAPFDLSSDYMFRADLIGLSDQEHVLVATMHHIASDGWSTSIIVRELVEVYAALVEGREVQLPPLAVQYADYAIWQRDHLQGAVLASRLEYWKRKLQGVTMLGLPTDYVRPALVSRRGAHVRFEIGAGLTDQLRLLSQQQGCTVFMTLLSVFKVLLYRYSGQVDICIGTPIAGRNYQELESLAGFFINTLALRSNLGGDPVFTDLLEQVKTTTLEAYAHQDAPFEKVVEAVGGERDRSRNPLFEVLFSLQNTPEIPELRLQGVSLSAENYEISTSQLDIIWNINETGNGMQGAVVYSTDLFTARTIERMVAHFKRLLVSVLQFPHRSIGLLTMLDSDEEHRLLVEFNNYNNRTAPANDKTVINLFEEQVMKSPGNIAVVFKEEELTYQVLNEKANQLAHYLRARGVRQEQLVPVCIEPGIEMLIAILGILKAGAAYVPIDPAYPEERISFLLEDTTASVVISNDKSEVKLFADPAIRIISLDADWEIINKQSRNNLQTGITSLQLAYVIYTSGSTGKPKGVMIEHKSLFNYLTNNKTRYTSDAESGSGSFMHLSYTFDASLTAIFMPLLSGKSVVISSRQSPYVFEDNNLEKYAPYDFIKITPSHLELLRSKISLPGGELLTTRLVIGGEALLLNQFDYLIEEALDVTIINEYGPTEATVGCTTYSFNALRDKENIKKTGSVSIGKPINYVDIYILGESNELLPIGVTGELCVGGSGLARGYLNRDDLTAEKFIKNPFSKEAGSLLYKTGDLASWSLDGNIRYLGRKDDQVKIRGYRIELGEIETVLQENWSVRQAAVLCKENNDGDKYLVAYIVSNDVFSKEQMISYLEGRLPEYMIPTRWVTLEIMPLTIHGKIDRKGLPDPDIMVLSDKQHVAPENETEKLLAEIWENLLEVSPVGITDDFFDLGGHSLLAIRLISMIRKSFDVEMQISDIFNYSTISLLAGQLIGKSDTTVLPSIGVIKPRPELIPLSFSQERLWFIDQLEGSLQYHVPAILRLKGRLHTDALSFAFQHIINRHEVLRSVICEKDGIGYQHVNSQDLWQLNIEDGTHYKNNESGLQQYITQIINKPFDLTKDHMLRADLIRLENDEFILVLTLHHIASDGWSVPIIVNELFECYNSYIDRRPPQLAPLAIQYADFSIWQRNYLQGAVLDNKIDYWKHKLQLLAPLELPTDFSRPIVQSTRGASIGFSIDKDLTARVRDLGHQQGATLFMTFLAAFKLLLYRYTGQLDICVGTPIAGRQQEELEGLIGFFVNTMALRTQLNDEDSFTSLLAEVKHTTIEAYEHQEAPFEKVVEVIVHERDMSRSPLFQVMFVLQNTQDIQQLNFSELHLSAERLANSTSKFDLTFFITDTGNRIEGSVEYCIDLYREQTILRMIDHYKNLLDSIVKAPDQKIALLPMLSRAEEQELLVTFNNTDITYPKHKSITGLFEEQVEKTPYSVAAVFEEEEITYKELNERSNRLANHLRSMGVKENTLVPICVGRSINMVIGVVGILKAGAAYVPVDPDYPLERINYIIEDIKAELIITTRADRAVLPDSGNVIVLELDSDWPEIEKNSINNPVSFYQPHHLAYLLYTSGSTGRPKGVKMPGGALVNLLNWQEKQFTNKHRRALQFASLNFDASFHDMFSSLCYGSTLYLISAERRKDTAELLKDIVKYKITHLFIPYIVLKNIVENIASMSYPDFYLEEVITAGEQLKVTDDLLALLRKKNIGSVINQYGPTEAHVVSSYTLDIKGIVPALPPIGKPIYNTRLYILGKSNQLVPVGVSGELYIGGVQVAQGYLNQPEQTAEKFIKDFFSTDPEARLYKTGDIARWLPDGNIEYLGRVDDQVKIRGFRIELGEIESVLQECSLVRQAVVLAREDHGGNKRLIGYIVPEGIFDKQAIISYLSEKLPSYMVPAFWVEIDKLPITSNGKINRRLLPEPDISGVIAFNYVPPRNEIEKILVEIWQHLLGIERVGIHDNFFELGGHSLLATRVVSAIRKQLEVEMTIRDLFTHPAIADLAELLQLQQKGLSLPSIEVIHDRPVRIRLSFSQERLWFIHQLEGSLQYHVPAVLRLKGSLNEDALSYSLQMVVDRHETLRTIFREEEGQAYQYVKDKDGWRLSVVDGSILKEEHHDLSGYIDRLIMKPFDLSKDYMMRATLINIDEDDHVLVVTMHHIASDGWSTSIIVKELTELYGAYIEKRTVQLPSLPIQYADYAIWQRIFLKGELFDKKLRYWKNKLKDVATLRLPTDFNRPPVWSARGATESFIIDKELQNKLQELSRLSGSTLFMTLLAAFKTLLYRYSGQQDICVGTPIAGRQQQELEGLIGFFVNTLALRSELKDDLSFTDLLTRVRTVTMEAYENQEVPFERVVDEVVKERDIGRNPLFQVMFVMLNLPEIPVLQLGALSFSNEERKHTTAKFDFQVFVIEKKDGLELLTEYCTDLFTSATIKRMIGHYITLLHSIIKDPDKKIISFSMLTIAEKKQLLTGLNNTTVNFAKDKNVVNLFEEQVSKTPDALAIIFEEERFTYDELNKRANQLAHHLKAMGVKEETLVTVCLERSLQMIVAIWGILKAGAAYVPIDPEYPDDRIIFMLEDTASSIIITSQQSRKKIFYDKKIKIIELDNTFSLLQDGLTGNLDLHIETSHLAYVIYTSGSTGKPKGVMNEHGGLTNRLLWAQDYFNLTNNDVILQKTTYSFDVSVWELLWPSLTGARLVFAKPGGQKDNDYLKYVIEKNKVTVLHFVPSMLGVFLPDIEVENCGSLRKVLCSGEALKPVHVELFRQKLPQVQLYNLYGPTEAAIDVTCWTIPDENHDVPVVYIGSPVYNTSIYILDDFEGIVPFGGIGELHIGGVQVARGYLNRPELTSQKFITDIFNRQSNTKLYKTGDLGRWMLDGNIEYLGRKDEQVKIRGFRIELGEIEAVLEENEFVSQAVVLSKTDKSGNAKLVSYFIPDWTNVKIKEKDLYVDRIANWKELYNTEYAKTEVEITDQEFNLIGWNSSFTGEAIPECEMRQWVDDIVKVILSKQPEIVLEIGCGTGLIYFPLAGKVKKYIGTDLSETSIAQITGRIAKGERDYGNAEFQVCAAHETLLPAGEQIDTIILNSIVQYFPGEDYLDNVMRQCVATLKGIGRIIVGDVRDNRLLELFKGRLQVNTLQDSASIREFQWAVEQDILRENELCIDPAYFFGLQQRYPAISHIEIQWKEGDYINELSLYRYTVVIYLGNDTGVIDPGWQNWEDVAGKEIFVDRSGERSDMVAIKGAPSPRLWKERALNNALNNKLLTSVGDLSIEIDKQDAETASITAMLTAASTKGYHYRLLVHEDPLKVNIIFERTFTGGLFRQATTAHEIRNMHAKTNIPLFTDINRHIQKEIRSELQQKLPDYMVPADIIALKQVPLTTNGKADRKFLAQREERSIIDAGNYLPPSTVIEHVLVTIWKDLLGIEQIGIEDNFFELGGDSILTIQIVSRLRRLGYELQPKDIFIHQTIGKLSAAIAERSGSILLGDQDVLSGLCGLLPIQQWHFEKQQSDNSYFNQAVLLRVNKTVSLSELNQAVERLIAHHDALRFRYHKQDNQWVQEYGTYRGQVISRDLQLTTPDLLGSTITETASAYQRSLDIEKGELIRIVWMQTPAAENSNRLLIVIHHLAVDGVSWRILLEDLELSLTALKKNEQIKLGAKTSSYSQWYHALERYGERKHLSSQLNYWQKAVKNYRPLPVDKEEASAVSVRDLAHHSLRLDALQTSRLLKEVPRVYHTEVNDILLAALSVTLCDWSGKNNLTIGLEGHGREDIDPAIDTTRTIGWFTSLYPLMIAMPETKSEADLIKSVKEQLRQLPDKGIGYGVLRYINKETSLQGHGQPWDIMFNYLGQLDNVVRESKWFSAAVESQGPVRGGDTIVGEKISVNSSVSSGQLVLSWSYSSKHYNEETIKQLSESYLVNLEKLITHCVEEQKTPRTHFTPSDYGLGSEIGYKELDLFLSEKINGKERSVLIEGLYRLSGLQEGMLFHGLYDVGIGAYIEQFSSELSGVEEKIFKQSWKRLIRSHSVLRSAFYVDAFSIPVQCVYKEVEMPIVIRDYRGMNDEDQEAAIKAFDEADWNMGFDFKEAPLMRLGLLRLGEDRYRMLWTSHHILFDGWSFPILMEEFLEIYESLSAGREMFAVEEDRYEDYIRYIERSDKQKEEQYWRNYLDGIQQNTLLPFIGTTLERNKGIGGYEALEINLVGAAAKRMHGFAQRHRLTLNTIMQGVWAYLLHQYTGNENIVYGIIVSGRPDDLSRVEQRVGMYINTLPLHSTLNEEEEIVEWLKTIQAEQVNSRQYQHTPFPVVQGWSGVQGDLFDTLLTFENYPFSKVITSRQWALNVSDVKVTDHTNYPLSIVISSAEQINIRFSYNALLLDKGYVIEIRNHFENVLMQLLEKGNAKLRDLHLITVAEQQQLLEGFNKKQTHYQTDRTIIDLFEAQVLKTPNALAVVFKEEKLTYFELNRRSNQLASYLGSRGVAEKMLVPICMDSSIEMMTGILGILKAGAAYVPIDTEYPEERIAYILEDTGASFVVTSKAFRSGMQLFSKLEIIEIDNDLQIDQCPANNPGKNISPDQLAYIIYTSGSTGKPKGVMIEHKSLSNYLVNNNARYIDPDGNNTGSFVHLSYTFDASLTALFMPLLSGKAIIIGSQKSVNVFEDGNLLRYAPYDFIKITPSHLELLQTKFKLSGRGLLTEKLVIGGEALYPGQFNSFIKDGIDVEVINEYGPTEATVGCTTYSFYVVAEKDKIKNGISIGKPLDNVVIYILNETNNLVPIGVKGQICIGGAGLARGYLNQVDLTETKFIHNPFSNYEGDRLYKTGDIGRWLPDGNIEYLGRADDQVKIRGYRVELGEIEHEIQRSECVSQAVVLDKDNKETGRRLMSYYVPRLEAVKLKERELHIQRVANWKELYETEYGQTEGDEAIDPEFNIIGWNDSFTGKAIPSWEMKEWLNDIVEVVLSEHPENVLEIGCGTGLIYYQLAGRLKRYIGSDLSRSSINQITQRISKQLRAYGDTQLFTAPAHEVTLNEGQVVDTILLNSIVQYFPGEDYMNVVIERSITLIKDKGRIIIGDVRDNRLLELFKARLRIQKSQDTLNVKEFKWGLEQDLIREEELCFSPDYFYRLKNNNPRITFVDIQWKKGDWVNELSLYRYTVVIYVNIEKELVTPVWQNWNDVADEKEIFSENKQLQKIIAIKDVPNPRLWKEGLLQTALQNISLRTVGEIVKATDKEGHEVKRINQLLNLAASKGYDYRYYVNEDPLKINLVFGTNLNEGFISQPLSGNTNGSNDPNTNIPLFADISFLLQKDIKDLLHRSLPDYMVPSEFIALNQLPLTNSGKVDRLFLSQREDRVYINTLNYLPPLTESEKTLAKIWKELLHVENVGIEDNFFDIGGHSLLAMRVVSAIRKELDVELNIRDLFVYPTIALLAGFIQNIDKGLLLPSIDIIDPKPDLIPLSFSQERLWFIDQLGGSLQYHMPAVLKLKGVLNKDALSNALLQIVGRHEILRTVIGEAKGQAYQLINQNNDWELLIVDDLKFREDARELHQYIKQLIVAPFDLSKDYMLRAALIRLDEHDHVLVATLHHIASDGWSTSIMVRELAVLYNAAVEHRTVALAPLAVQYADYAIWQRRYLQGEAWEQRLTYWKDKLEGVAALQLPTDYPRPLVLGTKGAISSFVIAKALSDQLKILSQQQGVTLFMTLLAAFNVLLYRYSGQEDICVGTPIAGRRQQELEGLIGFFVNTLALRCKVSGDTSFVGLLDQVRVTTLEAYEHQDVPFEKVVELVVKERDRSRSPLFQVMLALQNTPEIEELRLGDIELSSAGVDLFGHDTAKFELTYVITDTARGLHVSVEYNTDLFSEGMIGQLSGHYRSVLASVVKTPQLKVGMIPLLTEEEIERLVTGLNDTRTVFSSNGTVVDLFREQVLKAPASIALVFEDSRLSYRQLDERSDQVARYLRSRGVKEETLVPVCMDRSASLVTVMLGILKAGGAYVPIDPGYPVERIRYMLEDTGALLMVTGKEISGRLGVLPRVSVLDPQELALAVDAHAAVDLPEVRPGQLAYVIYTSGSTGLPKGVMIEHRSLSNLVNWHRQEYKVTPSSSATAMAGIGFDAFGWEVWPYLCAGASVHVIDGDTRLSASRLVEYFMTKGITHSFIATALVQDVVEASRNKQTSLQYLLTGGDKLSSIDGRGITYRLVNNYGPTENTVVASSYELFQGDAPVIPPIGKPVSNTRIYLLSDQDQLVPWGVAGELCIGGAGLARGYLNRAELTASKFTRDLFEAGGEGRLYRSGDLCRWLPDGNLAYLGRKDEQVKVRGYRIEPGEIVHVLQGCELVRQAVVVAAEDRQGHKRLAGYIVPEGRFDREVIASYLKERLPEYMIPALWVEMAAFPLTSNGKIDKNALPDPDDNQLPGNDYVAPRNETERVLVEIWKDLLKLETVGINDDFFELGGHSLLVMRMIASIESILLISIPIKALFQFTRISDLSKYLETETSVIPDENIKVYNTYDV